jgi:hypothetical protein
VSASVLAFEDRPDLIGAFAPWGLQELHWIDGASHVDLYDKTEFVTPAVAKLTRFYNTNLAATRQTSPPARR